MGRGAEKDMLRLQDQGKLHCGRPSDCTVAHSKNIRAGKNIDDLLANPVESRVRYIHSR